MNAEIITGELRPAHVGRIYGWVDLLRVVACFLVVLAHCCDSFVGAFDSDREAFITGAAVGSLTRPSVPLFVMMTAFLLMPLPEGQRIGAFWRKRIGRIVPPLIFWSIALPLLFFLYYAYANPSTANPMVDVEGYTLSSLLRKIFLMVFNFNFDTVPLWYLYMLVGLYLIMPVLNAWLIDATRKEVDMVLKVWLFTLLLPYLKLLAPHVGYTGNFGSMEILGACDWNEYGTFYYLTGFIGYVILAYRLKRWPLQWSGQKFAMIGVPMFLVGYAITFGGFMEIQNYFPGDYAYLEVIWYFTGINVFMMTFPVVLGFSRLKTWVAPYWLRCLAKYTFGIYLCHFFFVYLFYDVYGILSWNPLIKIILMSATVFICSLLLTRLIDCNRFTRRFIA